jgi:hypothetical protein
VRGVKVYVVTEVRACGCEAFVDAKATFEAAMAVAKLAGNRKVTRHIADKALQLTSQATGSTQEGSYGDCRT